MHACVGGGGKGKMPSQHNFIYCDIRPDTHNVMVQVTMTPPPLSPGPLHLENEVVVAVAVECCDGFLCILLVVVVDESKPLQRDKRT